MTYIKITEQMNLAALEESKKRNPHIKHHFEVKHLTGQKRDVIGFLGEFAACELLGINWKTNIREDYLTIDNGDGIIHGGIFDVKTETIPEPYFSQILKREIIDDDLYGRRLVNAGQVGLLKTYNIIVFGMFKRNDYAKWYPIGWLETDYILKNYNITKKRPDGGYYPFEALAIKTTDLKPIEVLEIN